MNSPFFFLQKPLYFSCNQCGACCREFYIPLSHRDVLQMLAAYPEAPLESLFLLRPAEPADVEALLFDGQYWHLLLQRHEDGCIFLQDDGRCGSYESRPRACRTFPFDRANLGLLQILPDAMPIYEQRCDHDRRKHRVGKPMLKEARQETAFGSTEFTDYRDLVERWNRWASQQETEQQTLEGFIDMIRIWAHL